MQRLPHALVSVASILSLAAGIAHAECGSTEGTITWKSGLDMSYYVPGEGFDGYFLEVAVAGDFLVTETDSGLNCFEIIAPGQIDLRSYRSLGYGTGLEVEGDVVYASGGSTLGIFTILPDGTFDVVSQTNLGYIQNFAKQGDYIYAACGSLLRVLDVSNPAAPVITASVSSDAYHIAVTPSRAYVGSLNSQVRSYNLADPAHPTFAAPVLSGGGQISGMEVYAGHLFITQYNDGLFAYDVSSPDSPTQVGFADTGVSGSLAIVDGIAAVAGAGTEFFDVTDPTNLVPKGTFRTVGAVGMAVADGVAYVAAGTLQALDLGDVVNPPVIGSSPAYANGNDLHTIGDYLVLRLSNSVEVVSIADPMNPTGVASIPFDVVRGLDVSNGHAYVVDRNGFYVVDMGDPETPVVVGTVAGSFPYDVVATGNRVYASLYSNTVVFDVSNPIAPINLGESDLGTFAESFTASGNMAYFGEQFEGSGWIAAYDFTDPSNPSYSDEWHGDIVSRAVVSGNELIVGTLTSLRRIDATTLSTIDVVGDCPFGGDGIHVADDGSIFAWNGSYHSFGVVPTLEYVSSGSTPAGDLRSLTTSDDYVFATDSGGLYVTQRPCAPSAVPTPVLSTLGALRAAPNPTSGATSFSLPAFANGIASDGSAENLGTASAFVLDLFTVDGRLIRSLSTDDLRSRSILWDGRDASGRKVPAGVILARVHGPAGTATTSVRILR